MGFMDSIKNAQKAAADAMSQATPGAGLPGTADGAVAADPTGMARIANEGAEASATVTAMDPAGQTIAGDPEFRLTLNVSGAAGPYDVVHVQAFHAAAGAPPSVGSTVTVKIDPLDPSKVLIWSW
jgi:hypothetical protein